MIVSKRKSAKPRKSPRHIWGELAEICRKIHVRWYKNHDKGSARRYQQRLEYLLDHLPENHLAIIRYEGAALLAEMKNDLTNAIRHRKREIQLTERAQKSVQASLDRGDYDERTAAWALQRRDSKALEDRRAIVRELKEQLEDFRNRNGLSRSWPRPMNGRRSESRPKHSEK